MSSKTSEMRTSSDFRCAFPAGKFDIRLLVVLVGTILGVSAFFRVGESKVAWDHVTSKEPAVHPSTPCSNTSNPALVPDSRRLVVPEYDRQMRRVVVSLPTGEATPELQDEVLRHLPEYTRILFLIPTSRFDDMEAWRASRGYGNRVTLVAFDPQYRRGARLYLLLPDEDQLIAVDTEDFHIGTQHGTAWAQDLFEVSYSTAGNVTLEASCVHKCFQGMHNRQDLHVATDNTFLDRLETAGTVIRRLNVAFKGGNILSDRRKSETLVFCGYDSIQSTRTVWSAFHGETLSDNQIVERFRKALGVDRVIMAGPAGPQPKSLYHLDQAMLLLPDSVVALSKVTGPTPRLEPDATQIRTIRAFLADLRATLLGLGYKTVDIETPVENVLRFQYYVNAIPYVDSSTGTRALLMPVFPTTDDEQIVVRNTEKFQQLGYHVVHVPTSAYRLTGGIHCLVNVLE